MKIYTPQQTTEIIAALRAGRAVVFPTETAYGVGCDATNAAAVAKIFQIKARDPGKPLLVVVDSAKRAKKYLEWHAPTKKLAEKYWEQNIGPLTVVGKYKKKFLVKKLAPGAVAKDGSLALRVTMSAWLRELCAEFGGPIVATSANTSGAPEIYDAQAVVKVFSGKQYCPDAVVNGGALPRKAPSAIVSVVSGEMKVLRPGEVNVSI